MRRKLIIATISLLAVLFVVLYLKLPGAEEAFQKDADIVRLRHLENYGKLIEEFRAKTGKLPLQGVADVPTYVHIANDEQIEFAKNGPPQPHKLVPVADLVAELEAGLGRPIDEYYDPQFRPYKKPNFYIYMVNGDAYFFAVHVQQSFPFARRIGDAYYKIEISNFANDANGACDPALLFAAPDFISARDQAVSKGGFFAAREEKYRHSTKQP